MSLSLRSQLVLAARYYCYKYFIPMPYILFRRYPRFPSHRFFYFIALFMQPKVNYVFCFCSRRGIEVEADVANATEETGGTRLAKSYLHWGKIFPTLRGK